MQYSENSQKEFFRPFIEYIPAELKKNWIIVYYVIDPIAQKLIRKRKRVPPHSSINERKKLAKKIIATINSRLERGWNPIIEGEAPKSLTLILDTATHYLNTLKTYKSFTVNFTNWLKETGRSNEYVINFNTALISDFLDCLVLKYGYRLKLIYADNLYTILGVLKSKDKCNLTPLYNLIAFFAALLACVTFIKV